MVNTTSAQEPGAVKPGWTTTEFYQTLLVNVIAAIVAIVTIFKTNFNLNGVQAAVPAVALGAATVAQVCYTFSRAKVKAAAQDASARVSSAQAAASPAAQAAPPPAATVAAVGNPSAASGGPVPPAGAIAAVPAPIVLTVHFDDLRSAGS